MDRKPGHLTKNISAVTSSLIWIKIVGLGNTGSGKTCIIKHFCEGKFNNGYQPTVGVDYGFKIQTVRGIDLRVHLWDLSGGSEYLDVRNELYNKSDAAFLVYDVTNVASFEALDMWARELNHYGDSHTEMCVVANKVDQKRVVSTTEGKNWAAANKAMYFETSCVNGQGIEELFNGMLEKIVLKRKLKPSLPVVDFL